MLVTASPHRANSMNNVLRLKVAAGSDNRIANRAPTDALALFVDRRAAFRVNGAIRSVAFVQSPMRRSDNCIGILNGNVTSDET